MSDDHLPELDAAGASAALQMFASTHRADPIERLIDDLPPKLQAWARETLQLRSMFVQACTTVLSGSLPDASNHAEWLRLNAQEFAYRWAALMDAAKRHSMFDVRPIVIQIPRP